MDRIMATVIGPTGCAAINAVRDEIERHVSRLEEGWARGYLSALSDDVARAAIEHIPPPSGTIALPPTRP